MINWATICVCLEYQNNLEPGKSLRLFSRGSASTLHPWLSCLPTLGEDAKQNGNSCPFAVYLLLPGISGECEIVTMQKLSAKPYSPSASATPLP